MGSLVPNFSAGSVKENTERLAWTPRLRVRQGQGSGDEACRGWLRSRASGGCVCQPLTPPLLGEGAPKALGARPLALPASYRMGLPTCRSLFPSRAARQPLQGAFRREAIFGVGVLGSCIKSHPTSASSAVGWGVALQGLCQNVLCLAGRANQHAAWLLAGSYKQMPFSSINQNSVARDGLFEDKVLFGSKLPVAMFSWLPACLPA